MRSDLIVYGLPEMEETNEALEEAVNGEIITKFLELEPLASQDEASHI